ncbi:hypothetical protein RB594_002585 [Gaeumannomyces avenae]
MSTIKDITSVPEWEAHLAALPPTTLLVIYFHAPWAPPCAQMATVLKTLAAEYPVADPPATSWVALDAEDLSDVSETYDVTAVPFVVLSRGGKVLESVSGNSAQRVRTAIEANAGSASSSPTGATAEATTVAPTNGDATATTGAPQDPATQKEELFKRLGDLVKAAPVMLFMKGTPSSPQCGFSRQIVAILRENSVKLKRRWQTTSISSRPIALRLVPIPLSPSHSVHHNHSNPQQRNSFLGEVVLERELTWPMPPLFLPVPSFGQFAGA